MTIPSPNAAAQLPAISANELEQELKARSGILDGHFCLSSGRHSDRFIQKFRLLEDPLLVEKSVAALLMQLQPHDFSLVVSAAVGGIILGYEAARQLGCHAVFVEKEHGNPVFRRGFQVNPQDRVLIIEDVVTTGGSVQEVITLVRAQHAQVVAVGLIVQRAQVDFGVRTRALLNMPIASYLPQECPGCAAGLPLQDPGSRRIDR